MVHDLELRTLRFFSGQCKMQTVLGVRKQWDYCCHVLICMVKTIVRSLRFTLTGFFSLSGWTFESLFETFKCFFSFLFVLVAF